MLGISPSKEKFIRVLTSTLKGIPAVLCANAVPMDGSITDPHTDSRSVLDDQDASASKPDVAKSVSDFRYYKELAHSWKPVVLLHVL